MSSSFEPVPSDRLEVTSEVGAALTDFDYRIAASLLKLTHALRLPKDTIGYLAARIAMEGIQIPVSQLSGFTGFTAQVAVIATDEGTSSLTYTDLATVGPQLSGLPGGQYLLIYGATMRETGAENAISVSLQVNSTTAEDSDRALKTGLLDQSVSRATTKELSSSNNTITLKYRVDGGTGNASARWLVDHKYQEL